MGMKFEKHEMTVVVFDSNDAMCADVTLVSNGLNLYKLYGGIDGGNLYVKADDM